MVFLSDKFIFDGIQSEEMGIRLVDTSSREVLSEYGVNIDNDFETEFNVNGKSFFSNKNTKPETMKLEFCLTDSCGNPIQWSYDYTEKILSWLYQDEFKEFISMDCPNLYFLLKAKKIKKRFNKDLKGILEIEFQSYYKYPIKKYRKNIKINKEKEVTIVNESKISKNIKPLLEIECLANGDITICNKTVDTNKSLLLKDLKKGQRVYLDNEFYIVTDSDGNNLFDKCNREWLRLVEGNNIFVIKGNMILKIKYNYEVRV